MNHRHAFTLIELLVVISIISLIASIVIGALSVTRANAQTSKRIQDTGQVQKALELYAADHDGKYPKVTGTGLSFVECWECGDPNFRINSTNRLAVLEPYLNPRPSDPNLPSGGLFADDRGYWYQSDGTDYKFISVTNETELTNIPTILRDIVFRPGRRSISVYSSDRSKNWTYNCDVENVTTCPPVDNNPGTYLVTAQVFGSGSISYTLGEQSVFTTITGPGIYSISVPVNEGLTLNFNQPAAWVTAFGSSLPDQSSFLVPSLPPQQPGTVVPVQIYFDGYSGQNTTTQITGAVSNPELGSIFPVLPRTVPIRTLQSLDLLTSDGQPASAAISINGGTPAIYYDSITVTVQDIPVDLAVTILEIPAPW
jgi:prepilin-type N-terminal cleavage/methylation domain-containing protein